MSLLNLQVSDHTIIGAQNAAGCYLTISVRQSSGQPVSGLGVNDFNIHWLQDGIVDLPYQVIDFREYKAPNLPDLPGVYFLEIVNKGGYSWTSIASNTNTFVISMNAGNTFGQILYQIFDPAVFS